MAYNRFDVHMNIAYRLIVSCKWRTCRVDTSGPAQALLIQDAPDLFSRPGDWSDQSDVSKILTFAGLINAMDRDQRLVGGTVLLFYCPAR
jgi:hypothetical protein